MSSVFAPAKKFKRSLNFFRPGSLPDPTVELGNILKKRTNSSAFQMSLIAYLDFLRQH